MREILFRGKGTHGFACGEWVYGYYVKDFWSTASRGFGILPINKECGGYCEVDPETIGQFTGLTDKNGKKIFEGDVVQGTIISQWNKSVIRCEVVFERDGFVSVEHKKNGKLWLHKLCFSKDIEVIGNIHDNPELLEASDDTNRL